MHSQRMFRLLLPVLACLLLLASSAVAGPISELSSHEKAARDLYRQIGGSNTAEAGANAMFSAMASSNPELAEYQDVVRAWYKKVFGTGEFELEIIKLYVQYFSEQELKEMSAFYKSPLGQKTLRVLPEVMNKAGMVGARLAKDHSQELQTMLQEAMKKRHPEKFPAK